MSCSFYKIQFPLHWIISHGIWKSLHIFFLGKDTHLKILLLYRISILHRKTSQKDWLLFYFSFLPSPSFPYSIPTKLSSPIHKITHFKVTKGFNLSWQVHWYWCVLPSLDCSVTFDKNGIMSPWNSPSLTWLTLGSPGFLSTPLITPLHSPYPPSVSWSKLKYQSSLSAQLWVFFLCLRDSFGLASESPGTFVKTQSACPTLEFLI